MSERHRGPIVASGSGSRRRIHVHSGRPDLSLDIAIPHGGILRGHSPVYSTLEACNPCCYILPPKPPEGEQNSDGRLAPPNLATCLFRHRSRLHAVGAVVIAEMRGLQEFCKAPDPFDLSAEFSQVCAVLLKEFCFSQRCALPVAASTCHSSPPRMISAYLWIHGAIFCG